MDESFGVRKERRKVHSLIRGLDKDCLSTYYAQLTMPRASQLLLHSFNKQSRRPLLGREHGRRRTGWGRDRAEGGWQLKEN